MFISQINMVALLIRHDWLCQTPIKTSVADRITTNKVKENAVHTHPECPLQTRQVASEMMLQAVSVAGDGVHGSHRTCAPCVDVAAVDG